MPAVTHQLTVALAVLFTCFATATTVAAQPADRAKTVSSGPPPFSHFDKNGDGALTLEEFRRTPIPMGEHDAVFASIDANGDGIVTESELASHVPPKGNQRRSPPPFSYLDRDANGILTLSEFKKMPIPEGRHEIVFSGMDANGDGVITETELNSHTLPAKEQRNPPPFKYLDLDGNGILTLPEFRSMPIPEGQHEDIFAGIDANGDGRITEEEFNRHKRPEHEAPPAPPQSLNEQLDPLRIKLLDPVRLVQLLDIPQGAKILDLGAGFGLFTFPFAQIVGENGRVVATDIDATVIKYLSDQIKQRGADNVEAVKVSTKASDPAYSKLTYDIIFASDVWWDIVKPDVFFRGLRTSLQPETGRLWIVSWRLDPDFTPIEFSDADKTVEALQSPGRASILFKRLSEGSRAALAASGDDHESAISDQLIADLNRMLEDPTLWPEIREQARAAGQEPFSKPELIQVATNLSSDLEAKKAFGTNAPPKDEHALKLLRGLNRLVIQDTLGSEVWETAFGPTGYTLRFWLDWANDLRNGVEPTILLDNGFALVQEHKLLRYHRIFELKRKQ